MTLYRKYRPQSLEELDSEEVREKLGKILSSPYRPHAMIFSGPKGTGKTSAARITAKVLNCEKRNSDNPNPCNECPSCKAITGGTFFDVIEIDAASNRGIEEIRELREKIKFAPVSGKYKVYIVDEVHMLTNEAFNALLKTLEEPPEHAVFIMATTEPEKLPATIVSRCVKVDFKKATGAEILRSLKRVEKGEGLDLGEEYLGMIAGFSDGAFRDATKMLEQMLGEGVTQAAKLREKLGRESVDAASFILLLLKKDLKEVLEQLRVMDQKGMDAKFFVVSVLEILHDQLLSNNGITAKSDSRLINMTNSDLTGLINSFSSVYVQLKNFDRPYLPVTVASVEWCEKKAGQLS